MLAASAIEIIGNTPLIGLDRLYRGPGGIIAKAEFVLPGGSVKDRAAKAIFLAARQDGRLKPGMPVVEMTSGNRGGWTGGCMRGAWPSSHRDDVCGK